MDEKSPQEISEIFAQFEKELARLEAERAKILADYVSFLEQKRLEAVMKKLEKD